MTEEGPTMHHKEGDRMYIFTRFGSEIVVIKNVYYYPEGGIAYGFYSHQAGRNLLKACKCPQCLPFLKKRQASGERYIGDGKGALIKL
jgi:hypothetical protein